MPPPPVATSFATRSPFARAGSLRGIAWGQRSVRWAWICPSKETATHAAIQRVELPQAVLIVQDDKPVRSRLGHDGAERQGEVHEPGIAEWLGCGRSIWRSARMGDALHLVTTAPRVRRGRQYGRSVSWRRGGPRRWPAVARCRAGFYRLAQRLAPTCSRVGPLRALWVCMWRWWAATRRCRPCPTLAARYSRLVS